MFPSLPPEPYVKHCLVYLLLHLTSIDQVSPYCLVPGDKDADTNKPDPCPQDSGYLGGNLPFLDAVPSLLRIQAMWALVLGSLIIR